MLSAPAFPQYALQHHRGVDLPRLACRAATELDDLRIGRNTGMSAVARLAAFLKFPDSAGEGAGTQTGLPVSPSTVVIVNRAISDARMAASKLNSYSELVTESKRIGDELTELEQSGGEISEQRTDDLERLINFCLVLSNRAVADDVSVHEGPSGHPYRR